MLRKLHDLFWVIYDTYEGQIKKATINSKVRAKYKCSWSVFQVKHSWIFRFLVFQPNLNFLLFSNAG